MLKILLIGHFLGDFYLQCNTMQKKKNKWLWLIMHALIYAIIVTLCFSIYEHNWWIIAVFTIFFVSHLLVDKGKLVLEKCLHKKMESKNKYDIMLFIIDQLIHVAIIFGISCVLSKNNLNNLGEWIYNITRYLKITNLSGITLTALVIFVPTSTFIAKLFDGLPKPEAKGNQDSTNAAVNNVSSKLALETATQQKGDFKAGKIIGYLERLLVLILFITELYTLIGLVLTAKSLARFKQLEDKYFAEKFLIGTLLSLVITILTFILCKIH